jgi:uncharacterized protein (TIGR02145 family)
MKKMLILLLSLSFSAFAQSQVIKNVLAQQSNNAIIVNYELSSQNTSDNYTIQLLVSLNGGHSWSQPLSNVSGDVGQNVQPGINKQIIWNVLDERQELVGKDIQFKIRGLKLEKAVSLSGLNGEFTDVRDGNVYGWTRIGNQIWMTENMRYSIENNSSAYNNSENMVHDYGLLYNYNAATNACPAGWHLPNDAEWFTLVQQLGGMVNAGTVLKSQDDWYPRRGTNQSGFNAKPSGFRISVYGAYAYKGMQKYGYFWSADEKSQLQAHSIYLRNDFNKVFDKFLPEDFQLSVRCIKD